MEKWPPLWDEGGTLEEPETKTWVVWKPVQSLPTHDPTRPGPSDDNDKKNLNVWGLPFPTTPCNISAYLILLGGDPIEDEVSVTLASYEKEVQASYEAGGIFDSHLKLLKVMDELHPLVAKVFLPLLFDFSFLCKTALKGDFLS